MGAEAVAETRQAPTVAPEFGELQGADGRWYSSESFANARLLAIVFVSNGCPTVRAYEDRLAELHQRHFSQGVQLVAINANNPHLSPGDTYVEMVKRAELRRYKFPYLKDANGEVARLLGAICTPHAFLYDEQRLLRYQGRVDDARDPNKVTSTDLADAIGDLLAGRPPMHPATEPFGCAIVW